MRPKSIKLFEYCYLGSWLVSVIGTVVGWNASMAQLQTQFAATPGVPIQTMMQIAIVTAIITLLFSTAITFVLWFVTAYKRANAGRIIITVLFGLGLIGIAFYFITPTPPALVTQLFGVVGLVVDGAAVVALYLPDSNRWFSDRLRNPAETFR